MIYTYILKHEYKSEFTNNINNYQFTNNYKIYYWKIFDYIIDINNLNLLYKYIQKVYNNEDNILIIYDNCIINNFTLLDKVLNSYETVEGKYENDLCFLKTKVKNLLQPQINYIFYIDGKL